MKFINFSDNVRVGDTFFAKRPKLTKYLYLRYEGISSKKFAWRHVNEYEFSGSNDLKKWTTVKRSLKSFLSAYEPHYNTAPFEIFEGQLLVRKNPLKGQILNAEVLHKEDGFWKVRLLEKYKSPFKPISTFVTLGFFREFTPCIVPRTSRLLDVE